MWSGKNERKRIFRAIKVRPKQQKNTSAAWRLPFRKRENSTFFSSTPAHIFFARRIGRPDGQNYARDWAPGFPVGRRLSGIVPKVLSNFRASAEIREMPEVGGG